MTNTQCGSFVNFDMVSVGTPCEKPICTVICILQQSLRRCLSPSVYWKTMATLLLPIVFAVVIYVVQRIRVGLLMISAEDGFSAFMQATLKLIFLASFSSRAPQLVLLAPSGVSPMRRKLTGCFCLPWDQWCMVSQERLQVLCTFVRARQHWQVCMNREVCYDSKWTYYAAISSGDDFERLFKVWAC